MAPLSYRSNPIDLIKPSFAGLRANLKAYLTVVAAVTVTIDAPVVASVLIANYALSGMLLLLVPGVFLYFIIVALILYVSLLQLPLYRVLLGCARGERQTLGRVFAVDLGRAWRLFWASLLSGLIVLGGLVLLIVPGLVFLGWFAYTPFIVADENISATAALRRSRELTRGHLVESWGTLGLLGLGDILKLVPIVGVLLNLLYLTVLAPVLALRYLQLRDLKAAGPEVVAPPRSRWNYLIIGLVIVMTFVAGALSYTFRATNAPSPVIHNYGAALARPQR